MPDGADIAIRRSRPRWLRGALASFHASPSALEAEAYADHVVQENGLDPHDEERIWTVAAELRRDGGSVDAPMAR